MSEQKTDMLVEAVFADSEVGSKYVSEFDATRREKIRNVIDSSMMYRDREDVSDCDGGDQTFSEKKDDSYDFGF